MNQWLAKNTKVLLAGVVLILIVGYLGVSGRWFMSSLFSRLDVDAVQGSQFIGALGTPEKSQYKWTDINGTSTTGISFYSPEARTRYWILGWSMEATKDRSEYYDSVVGYIRDGYIDESIKKIEEFKAKQLDSKTENAKSVLYGENPYIKDIYVYLGRLYFVSGNKTKALELLAQAEETPAKLSTLGLIFSAGTQKDLKGAYLSFKKALGLQKNNPILIMNFVEIKYELAKKELENLHTSLASGVLEFSFHNLPYSTDTQGTYFDSDLPDVFMPLNETDTAHMKEILTAYVTTLIDFEDTLTDTAKQNAYTLFMKSSGDKLAVEGLKAEKLAKNDVAIIFYNTASDLGIRSIEKKTLRDRIEALGGTPGSTSATGATTSGALLPQ